MRSTAGAIGAVVFAIILIIALILGLMCITKVPAGYIAVQYDMNGGIKEETLSQGWHLVSPTIKTTNYSIGLEQSYLTASKKGDSPDDESFSACSSEGKDLQIELTYTYQFDATAVSNVFTRFKGLSGNEVRDSFIKPNIVSWTKEILCKHKVADIIGTERAFINIELTDYLSNKFKPYGIIVTNVSLINIDVDEDTAQAINNKIMAQQNAETQAINNQTNIDKATAEATVKRTQAQADADAKIINAEAEAKANELIQKSITDTVIKVKYIERWNGQLPKVSGSGSEMIFDISGVVE